MKEEDTEGESERALREVIKEKEEATVIRRTIEPSLRDDPGWKYSVGESCKERDGLFDVRSKRGIRWPPLFRRRQNK